MHIREHKIKHRHYIVVISLIVALQIGVTFFFTGCGAADPTVDLAAETAEQQRPSGENADDFQVEDPEELTLVMVGDVLLHDRVEKAAKQEDGRYNFDAIFANTKDLIEEADLALVNQEVIIGGAEIGVGGYPAFNAPYEVADALADAGFDVVCHGTNHALDRGAAGILNCIGNWKNSHPEIGVLGIHDSQESADKIYIAEKNGMRIAILNYTYGTNGIAVPSALPYAVDYLSEEEVISDIEKAEADADFTIVCPHWGTEYSLETDAMQKKWTRLFADHGVDLVLGTHPHVIEPVEQVDDMLVYYSLGNFVNWTNEYGAGIANRMVGGMARITLTRTPDGRVVIKEHSVLPLVSHVTTGTNGVTVYPLDHYSRELAEKNEIRRQDPSFSLEYCQELVKRVWE